jgi:hypothetical protein
LHWLHDNVLPRSTQQFRLLAFACSKPTCGKAMFPELSFASLKGPDLELARRNVEAGVAECPTCNAAVVSLGPMHFSPEAIQKYVLRHVLIAFMFAFLTKLEATASNSRESCMCLLPAATVCPA